MPSIVPFSTVKVYSSISKEAVTVFALFMMTAAFNGSAASGVAPVHPVKVQLASAVAVRVTVVPWAYLPFPLGAGACVTEPFAAFTVKVYSSIAKLAVTVFALSIVTVAFNGFVASGVAPVHPVKV